MSTRDVPISGYIGSVPVPTRFYYDSDKPFEIRVWFPAHKATWVMGRDLFRLAAQTGAAGDGDVRLLYDGSTYVMHLTAPDGTASIEFKAADIEQFMYNVYEVVPEGKEMDNVDIDSAIARLLGE